MRRHVLVFFTLDFKEECSWNEAFGTIFGWGSHCQITFRTQQWFGLIWTSSIFDLYTAEGQPETDCFFSELAIISINLSVFIDQKVNVFCSPHKLIILSYLLGCFYWRKCPKQIRKKRWRASQFSHKNSRKGWCLVS